MKEKNCTYIFNKGYVDYRKFDKVTLDNKHFVTRLKDNAVINAIKKLQITYTELKLLDNKTQILYGKVVQLGSEYSNKTKKFYRIIKIITEQNKELIFVTNIFDLSSEEIA